MRLEPGPHPPRGQVRQGAVDPLVDAAGRHVVRHRVQRRARIVQIASKANAVHTIGTFVSHGRTLRTRRLCGAYAHSEQMIVYS